MEPSLPSLVGADTKAYLLHLLIVLVCLVEKREGDGDQVMNLGIWSRDRRGQSSNRTRVSESLTLSVPGWIPPPLCLSLSLSKALRWQHNTAVVTPTTVR